MAGLNEEGIDAIFASRPKPNPAAQPGALGMERADAIRGEIYRRHGIAPSRSLDEAIDRIEMQAKLRSSVGNDGGQLSAWANPEEREKARAAYAAEGKSPAEVKQRHDASIHLLDPRSRTYMQDFGRDLDFLQSEMASQRQSQSLRTPRRMLDANAIRHYDSNADERLARAGGVYGDPLSPPAGGFQRFSGWGTAAMNAVANPETPSGSYLTWAEIPAEAALTAWSGETKSGTRKATANEAVMPAHMRVASAIARALLDREAWDRARANHAAVANYKLGTPTPVANFPAGSNPTQQQIGDRIAELQQRVASSVTPMASERWYRTTGYAPPGWVTDPAESFVRYADPSVLLPVASGAKAIASGGRSAARHVIADFAADMGREQAFNLGAQAVFGGEVGRSWKQFWRGGGKPGVDFHYKSDDEVAQSRMDARQLHDELADGERLSTARREAYHELAESGALGDVAQKRARVVSRLQSK